MENKTPSILLIDDDKFLLDMYSLKFSKNNFKVYSASESESALKLIRGGLRPDILLVDVIMPDIDGIQLLEILNQENLINKSVVIILTNQGLPDDIAKAKKLNVDGYIIKATTIPSEVLAQVQKIYLSSKK